MNVIGGNQLKNTKDSINCFSNIKKNGCTFIQFDITSFKPSITEDLLLAAITLTKMIAPSPTRILALFCKPKNIFYHDGSMWSKKVNSNFSIAMGPFDSTEACELVGILKLWRSLSILSIVKTLVCQ